MLIPSPLRIGDKVKIISTARKISFEEVAPAIDLLKSWGLIVELGDNLFSSYHQFAGTDDQRAEDLQHAICDPSIKAIFCARGGYGTTRIIDSIDFEPLATSPKWIIGFSDITALLFHLFKLNIASIHGIMPLLFAKDPSGASVGSLYNTLFGQKVVYQIQGYRLNKKGTALGIVIGGNLSMIHNLIGTSTDIDFSGKILFIEDLDEYLYHIDRMMSHLDRAGKLSNLAGLIIGHFTELKDNAIPFGETFEEIIHHYTHKYAYPVAYCFPVGHAFDNLAMMVGMEATLQISDQTTITYNIIG